MTSRPEHPDSVGNRPLEELGRRLRADLSALERTLEANREFCGQVPALSETPTPCSASPTRGICEGPADTPENKVWIKSPCAPCPKRPSCALPCSRLEAYLDGVYRGKVHGETTIGVNLNEVRDREGAPDQGNGDGDVKKADRGAFRGFTKVESFDPMEPYKSCWHRLSPDQREVVELYYGEGKKVGAIAKTLNLAPSSVSGRLRRAKKVKEEYAAEMRRKEFLLHKELEAKADEI